MQGGHIDLAFLGGAQVDRFGNLNTTVIGDYAKPKVRLPGSGGAAEIAMNARRVFVMVKLSRRSFVNKLDFVTSPGHLAGSGSREQAGLQGRGPELVVTDLAVFDFANPDSEMQLMSLHQGVDVERVRAEVGWRLRLAPKVRATPPPSPKELQLLRDELDPTGLYSR